MRTGRVLSIIATTAAMLFYIATAQAQACTPTGFYRDGVNMTAAVIASGDISGGIIDATGCNIGIYYGPGTSGTVDGVTVRNANYFGILVAGDIENADGSFSNPGATSVDITNSTISKIGENPFNGDQHGVSIYYHAFAPGSSATGAVSGNMISAYQKGGIVVNGPGSAVSVSGNTVRGNGPVDYIAQNGIQIGYGATGQVMRNEVTGNSYTGPGLASSAGILIFGGCQEYFGNFPLTTGVQVVKNIVGSSTPDDGNDMGVALANYDPTCSTKPMTPTNNKVINNTITNDEVTNTSGNGAPNEGYQAGVYDSGVNDKIINNDISGVGYSTPPGSCAVVTNGTETCSIDTNSSTAAKVHANSVP